jgi:glyoxylase-like metal-dependent hydrolase (beta-lactamase superfamily II)
VRIQRDLAPGVRRIEHAYTNCYVITDDDGVTLVDACLPSTGRAVIECLTAIGRSPADIRSLLLTHGHFDHVGFARGLRASLHVPICVHADDLRLAAHPYRYRPNRTASRSHGGTRGRCPSWPR